MNSQTIRSIVRDVNNQEPSGHGCINRYFGRPRTSKLDANVVNIGLEANFGWQPSLPDLYAAYLKFLQNFGGGTFLP